MKTKEIPFSYNHAFKGDCETYEQYVQREIHNIANFSQSLTESLQLINIAREVAEEIEGLDPEKQLSVDQLKSYAAKLMDCVSGERHLNMLMVRFFVKLRARRDVMEAIREWDRLYPESPFKLTGIVEENEESS